MRRGFAPFRRQDAARATDTQSLDRETTPILTHDADKLSFRYETDLDGVKGNKNGAPDKRPITILAGRKRFEQVLLHSFGPVGPLVD
jgi:hypothetical protein